MARPTFSVTCETCGEELGGGYVAENTSILATAEEHEASEHMEPA